MLEEASRELLYRHQYSGLDLYLDTDGTDTGLRRMPPGKLHAKAIDRGWASTDHETGSILGPLSDLAEFAQKFLADRGYSAIEATSIMGNSHPRGDAVWAPPDDAPAKPADTSSADHTNQRVRQRRGLYRAPLEEWMADQKLGVLNKMSVLAIAQKFKSDCKKEKPELLPLLPQRLRRDSSMFRVIEGHIHYRNEAIARSGKATKSQ
jgi:hypothetical protein